jgi:hypothetical protein
VPHSATESTGVRPARTSSTVGRRRFRSHERQCHASPWRQITGVLGAWLTMRMVSRHVRAVGNRYQPSAGSSRSAPVAATRRTRTPGRSSHGPLTVTRGAVPLRRRCGSPAPLAPPTGRAGEALVAQRANPAGVLPQRLLNLPAGLSPAMRHRRPPMGHPLRSASSSSR